MVIVEKVMVVALLVEVIPVVADVTLVPELDVVAVVVVGRW